MRPLKYKALAFFLASSGIASLTLLLVPHSVSSQGGSSGIHGTATIHRVVNFAELARGEALAPPAVRRRAVGAPEKRPPRPAVPPGARVQEIPRAPKTLAPPEPLAPPVLAANFAALGDNGTSIPPDTQGAAGQNHLMVALNSQVRIQDKTGGTVSTVTLNGFWASTGAINAFDPKLLYDPFANRWIFVAVSEGQAPASSLLIGASQTTDPTGNWDLFRVDVDATNVVWGDYPSVGFNKDWVVVTLNMFTVSGNSFNTQDIYVFTKASLYTGTAPFRKFTDSTAFTQVPAITYDN